MCNGLPWVCQHLIPVVPAKAFSVDAHSTDAYDLIVANSEGETKALVLVIQNATRKRGPWGEGRCLVHLTQNHEL